MRFGLKAKETLSIGVITVLVVASGTIVHLSHLSRVAVLAAAQQAEFVANQLYAQSARVLASTRSGDAWKTLGQDRQLRTLLEASVDYSPHLLHAMVTDAAGRAMLHSTRSEERTLAPLRPRLGDLLALDPLRRLLVLYRDGGVYEAVVPLSLDGHPFGAIRVGLATSLVRHELDASLRSSVILAAAALVVAGVLAMTLASVVVRRLASLRQEVNRLRRGEFGGDPELEHVDEVGQLAAELRLLGRQLHQDQLRELSEKASLHHVVDRLEDAMVFFDREGRILFANRVAEMVIGDRPTALAEIAGPLGLVLTTALAGVEEVRNARVVIPAARPREFLVSVFFVAAADQRPGGGVVVLRDLDSIKTLQLVVSYSARLAALGRLTSGVAHELKNPLNAMMVHVELLREELGDAPGEARESLQSLAREIRRLDRMVQGFLRVIRPQDLAVTLIDVNALVLDVAALLEPEWQPEGVRFAYERDPGLPLIQADGALLQQAFLNILLNACEAMPDGGTVTIGTRRHGPDGITVTFADAGVGIPAEHLERIFELYYTTKTGGSGIGLSVVHRVVHLHDGEIGVESAPGRGTTITVRLPVRGPVLSQSPSFALSASEVS